MLKDWIRRWLAPADLPEAQQRQIATLPKELYAGDQRLLGSRLVVVDVETTGLSLQRDQVISIGAVAIVNGVIELNDQFEVTLSGAEARVTDSVLLHGLSPTELAQGVEPAQALLMFLDYVGDAPLLAFHAPFDQHMLEKSLRTHLNLSRKWLYWDVADIARWLLPDAVLRGEGLDDWLAYFGLQNSDRHHASADAMATAELTLVLLQRLRKQEIESFAALDEKLKLARKLTLHRI